MVTATPEEMAAWPEPNFVDPVTRAPIVIGLTASTMILVVIFTAMRFYGKGVLRTALGLDDWMMLVAGILSLPVSALAIASLKYGLGLHIWDQKAEWGIPYGKMAFSSDILFPLSVGVTKISLCLTYLRLFPSRTDRYFCYTLSIFVTLYTVVCMFLMLFQCTPISGYWDVAVKQHCINLRATLVSIAALNSVSDFLVYLWPAKPLWSLQLPLKQRLGLICIFSVGTLVCVAGALRMYYLEVYFSSYDPLWEASIIYALMAVEMNLGVICGCLSGVKPVLAVIFPRFFGSSYGKTSRPTYPTYGRNTGHPQSFAFQPLSDISGRSSKKNQHTGASSKIDHNVSVINMDGEEFVRDESMGSPTGQRNIAWASASGGDGNGDAESLPRNAIAVNQVITVRGEPVILDGARTPNSGKGGDASSEEWIMEELEGQRKNSKDSK
ncbi:hypothetical protein K491DRAFT_125383 [Lophiostoma macrostomum CBS 122681]|uniref:Rhodopsin domain-containing protein n=1 Tax=Lophiostoma macrostomum CBS 122681 TaxID=1314788 RepID=A0A6A6SS83_9PLEO|nr:hypothetical protein K491DRAFT_125383 [Lophiostoma macrostomum CBS 122681]